MAQWQPKAISGGSKDAALCKNINGDPPILGPTPSWRKQPQQAENKRGQKQRPRFLTPLLPGVNKDDASGGSPTDPVDPLGRPSWMVPGFGQAEPVYPSQKPDGNKDTVFANNINDKPPAIKPPDEDDYFLW